MNKAKNQKENVVSIFYRQKMHPLSLWAFGRKWQISCYPFIYVVVLQLVKSLAFLKKVPLSGGTFPYRPLWGVAPGGGEVAIDFNVQSASCQVNSNVRNNTEKNIRCNDWNPLRLQVFKNPFLRRLKSFEVYPSVLPSSLFFKSVIFGTAAAEHRHICVVCFVLLFLC